ncbi:hypothetical protein NEFER03_2026 [Nematocida sp. LUAm3]|nr:hypothetical protein NEFER03_2026 [Nematocida sp. LUAm3]KAI5174500.1 hypothetical protein NEFER02_0621 [Nematocida sp. LUAm2]KAI5179151.1 hypothetical protein NEFER01_2014 [Nematocida sp. LUAm1]
MQNRSVLIYMALCVVCLGVKVGTQVNGFGNGMPGYLYNVGTGEYLISRRGRHDVCTMLRTTRSPVSASRFKIQRAFYKGYSYNLIVSDTPKDIQRAATVSAAAKSPVPFYGYTVVSLLKEKEEKYLRLSTDTDSTSSWISFSPPFLKNLNAFKIYQESKCWTVDHMGYLVLDECTSFPKKIRNRQLFMWLPQNEYVSYKNIPVPTYIIKNRYLEKDYRNSNYRIPEEVVESVEYLGTQELIEAKGLLSDAREQIQSIGNSFHPPISDIY